MQSTSLFLMLMIGSCALTSSSADSNKVFAHFDSLDRHLSRSRMFDKASDGIELAFKTEYANEQFYIFTFESDTTLSFSITPCNNPILEWHLDTSRTDDFSGKVRRRPLVNYSDIVTGEGKPGLFVRINKSSVVESSRNRLDGDSGRITTQVEGMVTPRKNMKLHIKSAPSTVLLVYTSTRYSTKASLVGFPRIERVGKSVSLCVTNGNDLKVTVIPALSTEMADMDYCVAVNSKRPLEHRCSAQMLIPASALTEEESVRALLLSRYPENEKIQDARYKCTNKTSDITFKNLRLKTSAFFINVYVVNRRTELSSSFPTETWQPSDYEFKKCGGEGRIFNASTSDNDKDFSMNIRFIDKLYIKIPEPPHTPTDNSHWHLWFQPCSIPPNETRYRVRVQQIGGTFHCDRRLTQHPSRICDQNLQAPGNYKVTVTNPKIKELSSIAGNIILSHTGVYGHLFPSPSNRATNHGPNIDIKFHCYKNYFSVSVMAYKQHRYCFHLKETSSTSASVAENINLCAPGLEILEYAKSQCAHYMQWTSSSKNFNRVKVNFVTKIKKQSGYTVYVYYYKKLPDKSDRIQTVLFYGSKQMSVKRHQARCTKSETVLRSGTGTRYFDLLTSTFVLVPVLYR